MSTPKRYSGFGPLRYRFGVFLGLFLNAVIFTSLFAHLPTAHAAIRISFDARPNRQNGGCTTNRVDSRHKLIVHYSATVNDEEVINTRTVDKGKPVELVAGLSQTGWDHALLRLCCVGDQVTLKLEPPDIPYGGGMERVMDKIPKGSTVIMKIEILYSEPLTKDKMGDYAAALFKDADVSRDGKLTLIEFQQHFKPKNIEFGSDEYKEMQKNIESLFHKLDKDQDNALSLAEFTQARKVDLYDNTHLTPRHEFDHFDKNKDGKLDKKEIRSYYKSLKMRVPKDYWKYADVNEDGFISFPEFTRNPERDSGWSDEL